MISKWADLKPLAVEMRKQGRSLRDVSATLRIPKSTLSQWFKNVELTEEQKIKLQSHRSHFGHTNGSREKAVMWHKEQKKQRLEEAEVKAITSLDLIDINDETILKLALSMLYLGEGNKGGSTGLGNSDPLILNFFLKSMARIYKYDITTIKCDLHLRADQDPNELKKYWSEQLNLPIENFRGISVDKRSLGKTTYPHYKGVCVIYCGNVAMQRELIYLSRKFCSRITNL